jgi:hypothetical protein
LEREDGQRIVSPAARQLLTADSSARLARERGGQFGWCGPAAIALRQVAPERYAAQPDIMTAYWRDVMAALRVAGLSAEQLPVEKSGNRGPTLLGLARHAGLQPGLYLVRVTGHFLLLALHGFGLAQVHDNRLSGAVLSVRSHGLCRVTHLARLPGGLG